MSMNPRQRRGVTFMVLAVVAAALVFVGVASYVSSVNSRVGPMVTVEPDRLKAGGPTWEND